jgi:hypothetical protein
MPLSLPLMVPLLLGRLRSVSCCCCGGSGGRCLLLLLRLPMRLSRRQMHTFSICSFWCRRQLSRSGAGGPPHAPASLLLLLLWPDGR